MPVARKHERVHQCIRCEEYDVKDTYCLGGGKVIYEPMKLRYCTGFKPRKEAPQNGRVRRHRIRIQTEHGSRDITDKDWTPPRTPQLSTHNRLNKEKEAEG